MGGGSFMEGNAVEVPIQQPKPPIEQPEAPQDLSSILKAKIEKTPQLKKVDPEKVEKARMAWQKRYAEGGILTYKEKQIVEMAIEMGIEPDPKDTMSENQLTLGLKAGSSDQVEKARGAWNKLNEGKTIAFQDRDTQFVLIAMGISPGDTGAENTMLRVANLLKSPEIQRMHAAGAKILGELTPEQEAVRQKREELGQAGREHMQLSTIDPETTVDATLINIYVSYNRKLGRGLIDDIQGIEETVRRIEDRLGDPTVTPADRGIANNFIDTLENTIVIERQEQAVGQRRRIAEQLLGQSRYSIVEVLTSREARDEVFNNLFAGVDSTPHEFFDRAFNPLTYGMYYERFMDLIRNASIGRVEGTGVAPLNEDQLRELTKDFQRYQIERRVRQSLHDVNAALYLPSLTAPQLFDHMAQFDSALGDVAFKTEGVRQMMDLYEAALRENMMENNGYLKPEAVLGTVSKDAQGKPEFTTATIETISKARFKDRIEMGLIVIRDSAGNPRGVLDIGSWEIDRIFSIARGMMIQSERLLTLAAESKLPKEMGRYASLFLQAILQGYSPYRHLLAKYGVTETGLAAYLYKEEEGQGLLNILRRWNPNELKRVYDKLSEPGGLAELEESGEMRYLLLENPNKAGDIFTWVSWRAGQDPDIVSMTQDFLQEGVRKMQGRLDAGLKPANVSEEDYRNEYANWIGTGIRLERLRGDLNKLKSSGREDIAKGRIAEDKAKVIIEQLVRLQPHRLYLISRDIRTKVGGFLDQNPDFQVIKNRMIEAGIGEKEIIPEILNTLSFVESTFLKERERLLDEGRTFDSIRLDFDIYHYLIARQAEENDEAYARRTERFVQSMAAARIFAEELSRDFEQEGGPNRDHGYNYFDEFIYKREYRHGFVLWTGDAPVDEFNVSALGPSGGFSRRAGDNKALAEAVIEEIKLLANLKNIKTPDQTVAGLGVIYDKLAGPDTSKAKEAIAAKAEGIAKFFAADTFASVPVLGPLMDQFGVSSFAQLVYGKKAPVWHASEVRYFLDELKFKQYITGDQYNSLTKKAFATKKNVAIDTGSMMAQFITVALMLYLAERLFKEK